MCEGQRPVPLMSSEVDPLRDKADLHVEEDGELGVNRGRYLLRASPL